MRYLVHSDLLTPVGAGESSSLSVLVPEAPEASGSGGQQATSHPLPAEATPDAPLQKLLHPHRRVTSLDQVRGLNQVKFRLDTSSFLSAQTGSPRSLKKNSTRASESIVLLKNM